MLLKHFLIIPVLLICSTLLHAQKNKSVIDSLEKMVAVTKDSQLVKIYNDLTWEYRLVDREKAMAYGYKAIAQAKIGNFTLVDDLLQVLSSPYDEHPRFEHWAGFPPDWASSISISCSS